MYQNVFRRTNKKDVWLDIYQQSTNTWTNCTLLDAERGGNKEVDI